MKNIFTIAIILLSTSSMAYAYSWQHHAYINVTPIKITASVKNSFARPIVCTGQAYGKTFYGNIFNTLMNSIIVWPGQVASAWVYTSRSDRFVRGWGNIWCRWY